MRSRPEIGRWHHFLSLVSCSSNPNQFRCFPTSVPSQVFFDLPFSSPFLHQPLLRNTVLSPVFFPISANSSIRFSALFLEFYYHTNSCIIFYLITVNNRLVCGCYLNNFLLFPLSSQIYCIVFIAPSFFLSLLLLFDLCSVIVSHYR